MSIPHYINEDKSDMRSIKPGWYAEDDDGNLSSGPFSSREACVARITQPTNGTMASSYSEGRTESHYSLPRSGVKGGGIKRPPTNPRPRLNQAPPPLLSF